MHKFTLLICALICSLKSVEQTSAKPLTIGETVTLRSEILNEDRLLNIYLPLGYSPDSAKTYPVIYLLDGSVDEDIIHVAGLVQFCSFPWINVIPETIVVGIANTDRKRDFTYPTFVEQDKTDFPTTGGSSYFIEFIEVELIPFIEKNYKVTDDKTVIGQSLGGLLATEILLSRPNLFRNYFIISPSLWWDNESLLSATINSDLAGKNIYIAVGNEGKEMIVSAEKLHKKIEEYNASDTEVYFQYFKNRTHADILHQALYEGFEMVFKTN